MYGNLPPPPPPPEPELQHKPRLEDVLMFFIEAIQTYGLTVETNGDRYHIRVGQPAVVAQGVSDIQFTEERRSW